MNCAHLSKVDSGHRQKVRSLPAFEEILQTELQTAMDNLAEELKHEIRVQFDALSA